MSRTTKIENETVLKEKDRRFRETWQPRLSLIISVVALLVSVFAILSNNSHGISDLLRGISNNHERIIIIANLVVSIIAFVSLAKQKTIDFVIHDKEKFKSLAELSKGDDVNIYTINLNNRIGKLVNQFRFHTSLFAFSLILIYGIILIVNITGHNERTINFFTITTNLINLLGALFVQLGFSVLYNKTLEAHDSSNKTVSTDKDQFKLETTQIVTYNSSLYWAIPLLFFVPYTLVFISLSVGYLGITDAEAVTHFLNRFDLIAGSANGLAMSLLFGRYVSIEQSIGSTNRFKTVFENIFYPFSSITYKVLVSLGIIFILPVYALAQPLFGSLKIDDFGDANKFQTVVYAICLVGKICFFHLTYILISKGLFHLYLYGLVAEVGNFGELDNCFDQKVNEAAIL